MRATNTAAAVTSIDGARVDGDWRVTDAKEGERRGEESSKVGDDGEEEEGVLRGKWTT